METHLRALCRGLKNYAELEVIVANDRSRTQHAQCEGVSVTRLATPVNIRSTPICPQMAGMVRASRADLVHIHVPNPWAVLAYMMSGHRGALVVTWHSDVVRQRTLGPAFGVVMRRFLRRCNAIIATSDNYIHNSPVLSRNRERCFAVPLGISIRELWSRDVDAIRAVREQFGPRIILSIARLVYYKGIEYLIRAMNSVDANLLIVGDGPLRHKLEREATANPVLRRRVHFLGHVDDVTPYYHACDVFALPSIARSEGFGIVQLEAMACAKPVVNTRLPSGVPYVSIDGVTGITVEPFNVAEITSALNRLLDDADLRAAYGNAGLHRVRSEFTADTMVRRTLDVYRHAANLGFANGHVDETGIKELSDAAASPVSG